MLTIPLSKSSIVYELKDGLYINSTNRCTNSCTFCIRYYQRDFNKEYPLWMDREPSAAEILAAVGDPKRFQEVVFCGYGEPLIRLETVKEVARAVKAKGGKVRVNTDGQANLFHGRNIVPELEGLIDTLSISLNAQDAATFDKLCRSVYGLKAHPAVLEFGRASVGHFPRVLMTVVELPTVDIDACRKIAESIGAEFVSRPFYTEEYKAPEAILNTSVSA